MKIHLSAHGFDLNPELEKYASGKIAHLVKQIPRKSRLDATCEAAFAQTHKKDVKFSTCTITLRLDDTELKAQETTLHMYAALDIAAVHLEHQLADYVALQQKHRLSTRLKRPFRSE